MAALSTATWFIVYSLCGVQLTEDEEKLTASIAQTVKEYVLYAHFKILC